MKKRNEITLWDKPTDGSRGKAPKLVNCENA